MARARYLLTRRLGLWGILLTAWDVWRHLPPQHRKRIYGQMRRHAPTVARAVAREAKRAREATRSDQR